MVVPFAFGFCLKIEVNGIRKGKKGSWKEKSDLCVKKSWFQYLASSCKYLYHVKYYQKKSEIVVIS